MNKSSPLFFSISSVLLVFGVIAALFLRTVLHPVVLIHLVAGTAFLLLGGVFGFRSRRGAGFIRSYGRLLLNIFLFAAVIVGLNILSQRHDIRWDLTETGVFTLSEKSLRVMKEYDGQAELYAFVNRHDKDSRLAASTLLERFSQISDFKWMIIDPIENPHILNRHNIDAGSAGLLLSRRGNLESKIPLSELNEEQITNAFFQTSRESRKVYYVTGHGEPEIENRSDNGLLLLARELESERINLEPVFTGDLTAIPADASAVILASGKNPLTEGEVVLLEKYVQEGGALILFHEPAANGAVRDVASRFGIQVRDDVILDKPEGNTKPGWQVTGRPVADTDSPVSLMGRIEESYIITLLGSSISFNKPEEAGSEKKAMPLISSVTTAWGETDLNSLLGSESPSAVFDENDHKGSLIMALAYFDTGKSGSVVVFGDTTWAMNANFNLFSHRELALSSVLWSAVKGEKLIIPQPSYLPSRFPVTKEVLSNVLLFSFVTPEILLVVSLFVFWRRRRYA